MQFCRSFIISLVFSLIAAQAAAQTDSLRLQNGQTWSVSRLTVNNRSVKAVLQGHPISRQSERTPSYSVSGINLESRSVSIPPKDIAAICFADGFDLPFHEGVPSREQLLRAPTFKTSFNTVFSEGLFPLTQDEIRTLYGETLYRYGYTQYRRYFWSGVGKIGLGVLGVILTKHKDPTEWVMLRYHSDINRYISSLTGTDFTRGNLYPGWLTAEAFFTGQIIGGFVDGCLAGVMQQHLGRTYKDWKPLTQSQINARYIGGAGLITAGLGTMAGCYVHMDRNRQWYWAKSDNRGEEGQKPIKKTSWLLMAGGAVLTHFGVSLIEQGAIESQLRKHTETGSEAGSGLYGCQLSLGPAAHGYGLTLTF